MMSRAVGSHGCLLLVRRLVIHYALCPPTRGLPAEQLARRRPGYGRGCPSAVTHSCVSASAARSPARACRCTPSAAASNGVEPLARAACRACPRARRRVPARRHARSCPPVSIARASARRVTTVRAPLSTHVDGVAREPRREPRRGRDCDLAGVDAEQPRRARRGAASGRSARLRAASASRRRRRARSARRRRRRAGRASSRDERARDRRRPVGRRQPGAEDDGVGARGEREHRVGRRRRRARRSGLGQRARCTTGVSFARERLERASRRTRA